MELLVRLAWICALVNLARPAPAVLVAAPNIIHVDVAESVAIQVEGLTSAVTVEVYFENQLKGKRCSNTETFTLNSANNYMEVKKLKVTAQQVKTCELEILKKQKYIQLVATGPVFPKARKVPILLSTKKGYLFIQTEKPIYTPAQEVKFRVFVLDHVMRPVDESITVTVYNAQGLQVKKSEKRSDAGIINEQLTIPDISDPGVWNITARYTSSPEASSSTQFEVKKYVLPNFEVKILVDKPYFQLSAKAFDFILEARYVYGKSVQGISYVRFAILDVDGTKKFLRGTEQQIKLVEGKAEISLTRERISSICQTFNLSLADLEGRHLYIAVTVLEIATGSLEEQELNTVKFVKSPYVVDLSKTERYFVPGTSFKVQLMVSHTDGSVAAGIPVKIDMQTNVSPLHSLATQKSNQNGVLEYYINTPPTAKTMDISATVGEGENSETSRVTVSAYQSSSQSYLYISARGSIAVKPGELASFNLKPVTAKPEVINFLYYMALNKGQILFLRRVARTDLTNIQFMVTGDMIPSIRLVVYYYLGDEIVANSVWMDVEDSCEGRLHIESNVRNDLKPGGSLKVTIETDDQAKVALAAIDTAVYILNKKNKLTQKKVFQAMNEYDLGCTMGNGKDFDGVFKDAGLSFISSQTSSKLREGYGCKAQPRRKKRTLDYQNAINNKLGEFTDAKLKQCCISGVALLPPHMKHTCEQRSNRVPDKKCRSALLKCCEFAAEQREKYKKVTTGLGRTLSDDEEEEFYDEDSIEARTNFPESWLWKTVNVNKKHTENTFVPDSITTWEIQAISISNGKGFCIAEPLRVKVFQPFHIYLPLPYSVKRFEQLEIRPTLYNYVEQDLEVQVSLERAEGLCSRATSGPDKKYKVLVPQNSAVAVPFSIVPMTKQNIPVTVLAQGPFGNGDKITKLLKIVREGVTKLEEQTYNLDTNDLQSRAFVIPGAEPSNLIPDGDVRISVRVSADNSIETVNNSLAADGVSRLIRVPTGCAEQTMIYMAPGVYAMRYLDETEQWTQLGPERRDEARETMEKGHARLLTFRKEDGSYGAWKTTPSSTWLTAFIAKILSICRNHINVNDDTILTAVDFLMKHQVENSGAFRDPAPVWHREMQGGVGGLEGEVALTAFVTIALHHTMDVHTGPDKSKVRLSIEKAAEYLQQKLPSLQRPYTVAISAYALTLVSDSDSAKKEAHRYLMDFATKTKDDRMLYWESKETDRLHSETKKDRVPSASAITVEGTAFALMHVLLRNDIPTANKIVKWLTEQQNYGGGFKSTQDTVVALEALSRYWTKTYSTEGGNLALTISSPQRNFNTRLRLDKHSKQVQEQLQFSLGNDLHVDIQGKGKATLTILRMYNVMQVENNTCQQLKLEIELTEDLRDPAPVAPEYDYEYTEDDEVKEEPSARIHWQDLRSRRRRQAVPVEGKTKEVVYKVYLWREAQSTLSGMAIVDITMLSGFDPSLDDLNTLKDMEDRYISHYEYMLGRLLLYFETVPSEKDHISFRATQTVKVGSLQPASATLYDFYEPDKRCNIFYNLPSRSRLVNALCSEDVCQCAEGPCPKKTTTLSIEDDVEPRHKHACYSPRVNYGYKVKVVESPELNGFVVYKAQILEVLQRSKDEKIKAGHFRNFIKRKSCRMELKNGKEYLLMGQDGDTNDTEGELQYLLESNSWIEELATEGNCRASINRSKCRKMQKFMEDYRNNGCMV
ncbi:complement C4-like [Lissotriton helveticus]